MPQDEKKQLWVEHRSGHYDERIDKWKLAWAFYTGSVLEEPSSYITRRVQGESKEAWEERASMADFGGHLATVSDKFNGMLHTAGDSNTTRTWQPEEQPEGFGDPEDEDTVAGRLTEDYDGDGTDLEAFWKEVASYLIVLHECWILVDGPVTEEDEDGRETTVTESRVQALHPAEVVNTFHRDGSLEAVLVKEEVDERSSIKDAPKSSEQYVLYRSDRWERYRVFTSSDGEETARDVRQIGEGVYGGGEFVNKSEQPVPPIFRASLPFKRFIGWFGAKKEQAIFQKESERDFAARMSCFNKLAPAEPISDDEFDSLVESLIQGATVVQVPVEYRNPSPAPVEVNSAILKEKIETFYRVLFQKFEDEAAQATATAIRQQAFSGQDSFLNTLAGALDEAETFAMWLMGQIEFPQAGREVWSGFSVSRPRDFEPVDPQQMATTLKERYFGRSKTVPIGASGKIDVAKTIAERDGVNYNPDEIENDVRAQERRDAQQQAAFEQMGVN